jgi:hypothetical protein
MLRGAAIALTTPAWLGAGRVRILMEPGAGAAAGAAPSRDMVRAARLALVALARVPFSPWRNTCLYRSIALCRCLRAAGVAARLRVGVRSAALEGVGIAAHAWVEWDDGASGRVESDPGAGTYLPLLYPRSGG